CEFTRSGSQRPCHDAGTQSPTAQCSAVARRLRRRNRPGGGSEGAVEAPFDKVAVTIPRRPYPLLDRSTFRFERGLCPRNPFLGGGSEGAVEVPFDNLAHLEVDLLQRLDPIAQFRGRLEIETLGGLLHRAVELCHVSGECGRALPARLRRLR